MLLRAHLIHALQQVTQKSLKEKLGFIRPRCLFLVLFSSLQEADQKHLASFFFVRKCSTCILSFVVPGLTSRSLINMKRDSHSVVSDSLRSQGLLPTRLLCPWNCPGKSTGVDSLFQGVFLTLGSNLCLLGLLHCRQILYH